uniref:AMP-activated protein kinase glycogen-binding domain-containing protein n=2 Tax=Arcella intermedia TaxID=1963864 RepID=A0A6B2LC84_9EUKA
MKMIKNDSKWVLSLYLQEGSYQYKFIVDGKWCYDILKPTQKDPLGNINNVLLVSNEPNPKPQSKSQPQNPPKSQSKSTKKPIEEPLSGRSLEFDIIHNNPPKDSIVFFGDSDIAYWDVQHYFPECSPLSCGVPGATTNHILRYTPFFLTKYQPKVVVLIGGENDLGHGVTPKKVAHNFEKILSLFQAHHVPLIYVSTKLEPNTRHLQQQYEETNSLISALCSSSESGALFVDCYADFLIAGVKPNRHYFESDGIHLSPKGYQLFTLKVREALKSLSFL